MTRTPIIIEKLADVEDRIGYFDPRLEGMRNASEEPKTINGKTNPNYKPLNVGEYRKILLENTNKYLDDDFARYNDHKRRFLAGDKETPGEHRGKVVGGAILGGAAGVFTGGLTGGSIDALRLLSNTIRGKKHSGSSPFFMAGTMVGGVAGSIAGARYMGLGKGRQPIKDPGSYDLWQDDEALSIRNALSRPIRGREDIEANDRILEAWIAPHKYDNIYE